MKKQNIILKNKFNKGITLIALVITIIVLLLLAGVSIAMLTGENGILTQATNAKVQTENARLDEEIKLAQLGSFDKSGEINEEKLIKELKKIKGLELRDKNDDNEATLPLTLEDKDGNEIAKVTKIESGKISVDMIEKLKVADAIKAGLEVGDFINYDAGIWTQPEITAIGANGTADLPTAQRKFGGFIEGQSRNTNATPSSATWDYVKTDEAGETAISGWRVFDIDKDTNTIELISAGNPEDYYHSYEQSEASVELLTETRDWTMYENENYAESGTAKVLTKVRLEEWYDKYIIESDGADISDDLTFREIYDPDSEEYNKYQTLVDNYSFYWFGSAYDSSLLYFVYPSQRHVIGFSDLAYGLRALVSLKSDISLDKAEETKKVYDPRPDEDPKLGPADGYWEHSVWNIVEN